MTKRQAPLLGATTVAANAQCLAQLIEQFRLSFYQEKIFYFVQ
jgi:hypothetical protein